MTQTVGDLIKQLSSLSLDTQIYGQDEIGSYGLKVAFETVTLVKSLGEKPIFVTPDDAQRNFKRVDFSPEFSALVVAVA